MIDSYSTIFAHVARTLPDSLSERKRLLQALDSVLPTRHPAARHVAAQLAAIAGVEQLQQELPMHFESAPLHKP